MENTKKKAIVIDGNSLVYRVYYASLNQLDYYKRNNLKPANAIKLFLLIMFKLMTSEKYHYGLVAFDAHKKTQRHDEFDGYKLGRKPMPIELFEQLQPIVNLMNLIGLTTMSKDGIEADDLIGSFSNIMNKNDVEVEIFSSDKDMLQLVNEKTSVNLLKTGISEILKVNAMNFSENFDGLTPKQIIDFKGISGDSSDNLLGVKGIGPKTATELIKKYGTLENIYEHLDDLTPVQKEKFIQSKDTAFMCKKLATIVSDIFDDLQIDNFVVKATNFDEVEKIIKQYNLNGFEKYIKKT